MGNIFNCFKNRSNDQNIEYDDNFKEYFKMIHNKVYKFYKENQTNQFNITISLDKKDFNQIKDLPNSYLAIDDTEISFGNKIPLWLFGFIY